MHCVCSSHDGKKACDEENSNEYNNVPETT